MDRLYETIREVFADYPDDDFSDLKAGQGPWDSLGHLRLMMAIEAAFGRSIPPEAFDKLQSVAQIESFIRTEWHIGHG